MDHRLRFGNVTGKDAAAAARLCGTPVYLYDESFIREKCREIRSMPNAFGISPRYAMKANSNRALLQLIAAQGFGIDASSLNEARRARAAGIPLSSIMLTTQEVPLGADRADMERMMRGGMSYTVCSLRQLELVSDFAARRRIPLAIRVHPGQGSGESATRNTGDKYSCFGVHLSDLPRALETARGKGLVFDTVHVHIGSGGDPARWRENVDREIGFVEKHFPQAVNINFGGGLRTARMPDEVPADPAELGAYAKERLQEFHTRTGRPLVMEVEPGTYVMANAAYIVTAVIDVKNTGPDGFQFLVCSGGMEVNARPLLYGSRHPFYVVSADGELRSSEFNPGSLDPEKDLRVVVGRCCESGDSQSLDAEGRIVPRLMAEPRVGDLLVIGGCGAYCSSMSPFNYNSHGQAPEVLLRPDGRLDVIRRAQTLAHMTAHEVSLRR